MYTEKIAYDQIAKVLGRHFDFMFYIDIESGSFCEVVPSIKASKLISLK